MKSDNQKTVDLYSASQNYKRMYYFIKQNRKGLLNPPLIRPPNKTKSSKFIDTSATSIEQQICSQNPNISYFVSKFSSNNFSARNGARRRQKTSSGIVISMSKMVNQLTRKPLPGANALGSDGASASRK